MDTMTPPLIEHRPDWNDAAAWTIGRFHDRWVADGGGPADEDPENDYWLGAHITGYWMLRWAGEATYGEADEIEGGLPLDALPRAGIAPRFPAVPSLIIPTRCEP